MSEFMKDIRKPEDIMIDLFKELKKDGILLNYLEWELKKSLELKRQGE
jgi:peptide subunit release factor 1 (eRF1)